MKKISQYVPRAIVNDVIMKKDWQRLHELLVSEELWPFARFETRFAETSVMYWMVGRVPVVPELEGEDYQFECWKYALDWASSRGFDPLGTVQGAYPPGNRNNVWSFLLSGKSYKYTLAAIHSGSSPTPEILLIFYQYLVFWLDRIPETDFKEVIDVFSELPGWSWMVFAHNVMSLATREALILYLRRGYWRHLTAKEQQNARGRLERQRLRGGGTKLYGTSTQELQRLQNTFHLGGSSSSRRELDDRAQ